MYGGISPGDMEGPVIQEMMPCTDALESLPEQGYTGCPRTLAEAGAGWVMEMVSEEVREERRNHNAHNTGHGGQGGVSTNKSDGQNTIC